MAHVRVKICGITNEADAAAAVEAGADALGFIFYVGSPRFVRPERVAGIVASLPPFVTPVGVFVDASRDEIRRIAGEAGIKTVQLHGQESPDLCASLSLQTVKAFRVKDEHSLGELPRYQVAAFLLDSWVPGQHGGTGAAFNWELAVRAKDFGTPIILAGGLTPENVDEAVARVAPYGLDVSSGVETAPGQKDHAKVREFVSRAKGRRL